MFVKLSFCIIYALINCIFYADSFEILEGHIMKILHNSLNLVNSE